MKKPIDSSVYLADKTLDAIPDRIGELDRAIELLTAKIFAEPSNDADTRESLLDRISELQRRRVDISEPKAFRNAAAFLG